MCSHSYLAASFPQRATANSTNDSFGQRTFGGREFQDFNKWFSSKLEEKKLLQPAHKYHIITKLALAATQDGGGVIKVDICAETHLD